MKALMTLILTTLTLNVANASWMQETCSSADGTFTTAMGHNENFIQYTLRKYNAGGADISVVKDESGDLRFDISDEKELVKESHQGCLPGEKYGFGSWREVNYRKLTVRREDGGVFPETAVGVSKDLKTITAEVLCEMHGSSEIMCPGK